MDLKKLEKIFQSEKPFRLKQAKQAIFRDLIESWSEVTTLPIEIREKLTRECPIEIKAEFFPDKDGKSAKALIMLEDGLNVETVLMKHYGRNTVCISSQIGCPLGCVFCATGKMGFKRSLSFGEIVEQVLFWARYLKKEKQRVHPVKSPANAEVGGAEFNKVKNIVFMGMGEPFLNYDNVFETIKILNDDNYLGIGARHISISTVGIIEGIERMAEDMPQINLAISLHAPENELREKLMPINKKYPLARIMMAAKDYVAKTNRKLMFEYIMIKGVNDSEKQAKELVDILNDRLFFVNLIVCNPTGIFEPSEPAQIKIFKDILMKAGIQALERYRFGQEVKGACGQLAQQ